jgi:hypothetical protein
MNVETMNVPRPASQTEAPFGAITPDVLPPPMPAEALIEGYSRQMPDGTIEWAPDYDTVLKVCPFLAKLATEDPGKAQRVLDLEARGAAMRHSIAERAVTTPSKPKAENTAAHKATGETWLPKPRVTEEVVAKKTEEARPVAMDPAPKEVSEHIIHTAAEPAFVSKAISDQPLVPYAAPLFVQASRTSRYPPTSPIPEIRTQNQPELRRVIAPSTLEVLPVRAPIPEIARRPLPMTPLIEQSPAEITNILTGSEQVKQDLPVAEQPLGIPSEQPVTVRTAEVTSPALLPLPDPESLPFLPELPPTFEVIPGSEQQISHSTLEPVSLPLPEVASLPDESGYYALAEHIDPDAEDVYRQLIYLTTLEHNQALAAPQPLPELSTSEAIPIESDTTAVVPDKAVRSGDSYSFAGQDQPLGQILAAIERYLASPSPVLEDRKSVV